MQDQGNNAPCNSSGVNRIASLTANTPTAKTPPRHHQHALDLERALAKPFAPLYFVVASLILAAIMFAWPATVAHAGVDDLEVVDYQYVTRRRAGRTFYDYTYTITVNNSAEALQNVVATATSTSPNTTILNGVVPIGDIGAGASVQSTEFFTFRQNRRFLFDPNSIIWTFTADPAGPTNNAPVADAGPDQTVDSGATVILNGSASTDADGDTITYAWMLQSVPPGSTAALDDPTSVMPVFIADIPGEYTAQLIVNDGEEDSLVDTVVISTVNTPPVADAGLDQTAPVGATVIVFGGASNDANGDPLTYAWSLVSAPPESSAALTTLVDIQTTFIIDVAGEYVVQLIVNDGYDDSAPDTATITTENSPPVADAGLDQTVDIGDTVNLDGTFSFDVDDDPLTYLWSLISSPDGSTAAISDSVSATTQFIADLEGIYVAQLTVNDGTLDSLPDTAMVTAIVGNQAPTAVATADRTNVPPGAFIQLDGSASTDPEDDVLTYLWSLMAPAGSSAALSSTTGESPTFTADVEGSYFVTLVVNDGNLDSGAAGVNVTASLDNSPPVLAAIGNRVMFLGDTLNFRVFGIDPDVGDTLSYSLPTAPANMGVNGPTGDVSFTPIAAQLGINGVTARVEDGAGLFDTQDFMVEVREAIVTPPENAPPTLAPIDNVTTTVENALTIQTVADDPDSGDTISYSLPLAPDGMTISGTGEIRWTPLVDQDGLHDVTVQVADDLGAVALQSFTVTVDGVDQSPVALDDIYTARIGDTLNVASPGVLGNDNDPNGDALTALLVNDSTAGDLNLNDDGSFSYRPQTPISLIVPVPVAGDLVQLVEPVRLDVSSYQSDDSPQMAIDGDPSTSWFTADGDAANLGGSPFYQITFPQDVTVNEIEMQGNRDPADGFDILQGLFQLFDENGNEIYNSGNVALVAPDRDITLDVGSIDAVRQFRFTATDDESASPGFSELQIRGSAVTETYKRATDVELTRFGPIDVRSSTPQNATGNFGATAAGVDQTPISFWWSAISGEDPFYEIDFRAGEATVSEVQMIVRQNTSGIPLTNFPFTSARIQLLDSVGATLFDTGLMENLVPGQDVIVPIPDVENVRTVRFEGAPTGGTFGELRVIGDGLVWPIRPELEWSWTEPSAGAPGGALFGNVSVTPTSADLDGDGFMELIFIASTSADGFTNWPGYLVVLDGRTGDEVAIIDDPTLRLDGPSSLAVGDIDNDGLPEIIATGESFRELIAFENDLSVKWRSEPINGTIWGSIAIANIDGEGLPEILAGNQALNADGEVLWTGVAALSPGKHTIAADLDLDGQMEVLAGSGVYTSDGTFLWRNLVASPSLATGNFDDDPFAEVVVSGRSLIQVFEHDGTMIWEKVNGDIGGGPPTVADFDGDGKPEIGQLSFNNYTVYDTDGRIMWQMPALDGSVSTSATVFDLDGDGSSEVIMHDEDFLKIFRGTDGELLFRQQISSSTAGEGPIVADIDSDGQAEIVVTSTAASRQLGRTKGIFVFGGFDGDWVRTREIWNQHSYHVTNVNTDLTIPVVERNNWLTSGLNNYRQQAFSPDDEERLESFTYQAIGAGQPSNTATVSIDSQSPNAPPEITSIPITAATAGFEYFYAVNAVDVDFDPLTFSLVEGPASMTVDAPTGLLRWMPTDSDSGEQFVTVSVADPGGQTAIQRYSLSTNAGVVVPDVIGQERVAAEAALAGANLQAGSVAFSEHPTVALGSVAIQSPIGGSIAPFNGNVNLIVSLGAGPADIDDDGDGFTDNLGDCSDDDPTIFPGATDIPGDGIDQDCDGNDAAVPPAEILVTPLTSTILTDEVVALSATGIYEDGTSANLTGVVAWTNGPAFGSATAGSFTVTASLAGVDGSASVDVVDRVAGDVVAPIASITSPSANSTITEPVDVIGTATDENFLRYELAYAVSGDTNFTLLTSSTAQVTNGVLGQFDPTMLINDLYTIRLTVFDAGGTGIIAEANVQVDGNMKVGNFTLNFNDLSIPMSGIPITVTRTYDSRNKQMGDFGVGWDLDIQTLQLSTNRVLGTGWQVDKSRFAFLLSPNDEHTVSVTLPSGRVEIFDMIVTPSVSPIIPFPPSTVRASFRPRPGTVGTLHGLDNNIMSIFDPQPGAIELLDDLSGTTFNPENFRYTSADGVQIVINKNTGVRRLTEPNGNTLTFEENGIFHSAGKQALFERDDQGRISRLVAPNGAIQSYTYDANGDLTSHTDRGGIRTQFSYNRMHGLLSIVGGNGNLVSRNEYDENGRLVRSIDASGNSVAFAHDIGSRQEIITNRVGAITAFEYDARGNILTRTDANGNVWRFTYDESDNQLTRTDPEGRVWTSTYDQNRRQTSQSDPLGSSETATYDELGRILTRTDSNGDRTEFSYDSRGNLLSMSDSIGLVSSSSYDPVGNLIATTDGNGNVTSFGYNQDGVLSSVTNALGETIQYSPDILGNSTETRYELRDSTGVSDVVWNYEYDANGNLISTFLPGIATPSTVTYDNIGLPGSSVDPIGNSWEAARNSREEIEELRFGDTTLLTATYDAEGRSTSVVAESFGTLEREFDLLGNEVELSLPDTGATTKTWNSLGGINSETDPSGNLTSYVYDAIGRLARVDKPESRTQSLSYDSVGNIIRSVDETGLSHSYDVDQRGRVIEITTPDGLLRRATYDSNGNLTNEDRALGESWIYSYDELNRVTEATNPLGDIFSYGYDSNGQPTSVVSPLNKRTNLVYDRFGQMTSYFLPEGQERTFAYDALGRIVSLRKFDGEMVQFAYDDAGRTLSRSTSTGLETTTFDFRGRIVEHENGADVTQISYDGMGRITSWIGPDNLTSTYERDLNGRVMRVSTSSGDTEIEYNGAGEISSVGFGASTASFERNGLGIPVLSQFDGGISATGQYDEVGRAQQIQYAQNGSTLFGLNYVIDAGGRVLRRDHSDGTSAEYEYDVAGRLIRESLVSTVDTNIVLYNYDADGNISSVDLDGVVESYVRDNNDRPLADRDSNYSWDANGNLTGRTTGTVAERFSYDSFDRLISFARTGDDEIEIAYTYDRDGLLRSRTANGDTALYSWDRSNPSLPMLLEERTTDGDLVRRYFNDGMFISHSRDSNGSEMYYVRDHLGTPRATVDENGSITNRLEYDAYGNLINGQPISIGFTNAITDPDTGFVFMRSRWYSPSIRQFVHMDSAIPNPLKTTTFNRYAYSSGDPVNRIDPTGQSDFFLASVITRSAITVGLAAIGHITYINGGPAGVVANGFGLRKINDEPRVKDATFVPFGTASASANAGHLGLTAGVEVLDFFKRNEQALYAYFGPQLSLVPTAGFRGDGDMVGKGWGAKAGGLSAIYNTPTPSHYSGYFFSVSGSIAFVKFAGKDFAGGGGSAFWSPVPTYQVDGDDATALSTDCTSCVDRYSHGFRTGISKTSSNVSFSITLYFHIATGNFTKGEFSAGNLWPF